ncbi:MAG: Crp/Fnr family transcriptional regulator [Armatimonadota bacterium]
MGQNTVKKNINIEKILKNSYFFNILTGPQLNQIAGISSLHSYKKGNIIFFDGDKSNGFYLLVKGKIRIYKLSPRGKEQTLNYISENEPFGEAALFMDKHFPANSQAEDNCEVLFIKKADFISIIKENPEISLKFLGVLSQRLKTFAGLIESLSLKEVPARIAQYLIELSKEQKTSKIKLPLNKTQLAILLGTTSESLSRTFAKMSKQKLVKVENKYITILNHDLLKLTI